MPRVLGTDDLGELQAGDWCRSVLHVGTQWDAISDTAGAVPMTYHGALAIEYVACVGYVPREVGIPGLGGESRSCALQGGALLGARA